MINNNKQRIKQRQWQKSVNLDFCCMFGKIAILIIMCNCFFMGVQCITLIQLIPNSTTTITMYNISSSSPYDSQFIEISTSFNCSLSILYTYKTSQTNNNIPYSINLYNTTNTETITITSVYNIIEPTINNSTSLTLNSTSLTKLSIRNGCPSDIGFFNYYDRLEIKISGLQMFSYNVICTDSRANTFQWGLFIIIFISIFLITIVAIYSKAWSIGGKGIKITYVFIVVFDVLLIIGAIIGAFSFTAINIIVEVLAWILGTLGVGLCFNQVLFLVKVEFLKKGVQFKGMDFRVMEGISLLCGLGCTFGWYFSNKNWIVNDILAICMVVAAIKIFKITSLKIAIIGFASALTIQIIFIMILSFAIKINYNNAILNQFNNPFQIQVPTINAVYNQKCSWLPITAIAYPGAIMAYMRRFDSSRNTNVYLITCVCTFLIGAITWMFVSIVSPVTFPFGFFAEPATCGLVALFAWKRKEIRTLWTGKFHDQQFANRQALENITEMIKTQKQNTNISMKGSLFKGLYINDDTDSVMQPSQILKKARGDDENNGGSSNGNSNDGAKSIQLAKK